MPRCLTAEHSVGGVHHWNQNTFRSGLISTKVVQMCYPSRILLCPAPLSSYINIDELAAIKCRWTSHSECRSRRGESTTAGRERNAGHALLIQALFSMTRTGIPQHVLILPSRPNLVHTQEKRLRMQPFEQRSSG